MSGDENEVRPDGPPVTSWTDFLEATPPGQECRIEGLLTAEWPGGGGQVWKVQPQDIQLHCGSSACGGVRTFATVPAWTVVPGKVAQTFVHYVCRNCRATFKTFAVRLSCPEDPNAAVTVVKFGEIPFFGPPVPSRLISLIGPDRDLFLRGRRAENLGLGIGAFAYYRRVVENQKSRLIEQIGKVAARLGANEDAVASFDRAANETQFSRAIEIVKGAIPPVLLIDGHNPLSLLHSALSEGLHANTDEDCLDIASSIRMVLAELADRVTQALKDEAELKNAISRLLNRAGEHAAPKNRPVMDQLPE